jgi:TonB family protein
MPRILMMLFASSLAVFAGAGATLSAQSSIADIKARLLNKPLYLRGTWRDDSLRFDEDGKLIGSSAPISFTLAGFNLGNVSLKSNRLLLDGTRMGTEFIKDVPKRVSLDHLHLEIAKPPSGDFTKALDAIFADGLDDLAKSLPWYWQDYATCTILHLADSPNCSKYWNDGSIAKKAGEVLSAPRITKSVDAKFTEAARLLHYAGNSRVSLVVNQDGTPSHFSVIQAAGLGLDEQALAAVANYKFTPAMKDKKPIASEVQIQVKFTVFGFQF